MTTMTHNVSAGANASPLRARPPLGLGAAWIGDEEEALVLDVLRRKELSRYYARDANAPPAMAATLEAEFCAHTTRRFALAVSSGSAALECALGALEVGPGDEVITTAWGWVACFTTIVRMGARPVLAEIDDSFCLAPGEITRLATPRTKAVSVIHFQGLAADMNALLPEAEAAGIALVEDCAQSPGATYHGRPVGSLGTVGTFSFQYSKAITSGEGGLIVMDDPILYERAVRMSDLGMVRPYHHQFVTPQVPAFSGGQYRLGEMQAAVALAQLRKLGRLRAHCRDLSARVRVHIEGLPGLTPRRAPDPGGDMGFELYLCLPTAELAGAFRQRLHARNVNCQQLTGTYCHYARPYCQTGHAHAPAASPFAPLGPWPAPGYRQEDFPQTEALIHRFVALPLGALYTLDDADYIGETVRSVHAELLAES